MAKAITTVEEYRKALSFHDWTYMYSDDHRAYTKGREQMEEIQRAKKVLDPDGAIFAEYAPEKRTFG